MIVYVKELKYYGLQTVFRHIIPTNMKLSLNVDGYMKNGGKKNGTDSKLDLLPQQERQAGADPIYLWDFPTMYV